MPEVEEKAPETDAGKETASDDKKSLETLISGLSEADQAIVLREVRQARSEAHNLRTRLNEAAPKLSEYDKLVEASKSELQRAQDLATSHATKAQAAVAKLATAEVRAAAADKFADPSDAVGLLDPAKFVSEDGEVDSQAISTAVADLLTKKPHLAKRSGPRPDPSQGAGANGAPLTPADQFAGFMKRQLGR